MKNCSTKISREHYVSRAVLEEIGDNPLLSGLAFLGGEAKRLPTSGLVGKVLCTRHNSMLSPLDLEALKVFRTLRQFESDLRDSTGSPADAFTLVNGPRLEAWLLKTFCGLLAKQLLTVNGQPLTGWRAGAEEILLRVLFQGDPWPSDWGLWGIPQPSPAGAVADLALATFSEEGLVWAAGVDIGPFPLRLTLGRPGASNAVYRPGALVIHKEGSDVQKTLALGWPEGFGSGTLTVTRVGEMNDWDISRPEEPS